jgi:hypothetical protein
MQTREHGKHTSIGCGENVEALKAIKQYNIHSVWFDVGYGGCCFGIFSAGGIR